MFDMQRNSAHFRIALLLCFCAALWFALGGVLKVVLAHSSGKTIEMVVCSGAGVKKIYVHLSSPEPVKQEVSVKHCSNTPLALVTPEWDMLDHLGYVAPMTLSALHFNAGPPLERSWLRNGKPPPGRAPPALFIA